AHPGQVFAGGAVRQDRVRRRQMVGGDVVRQHRQRAHAGERALARQRAFPVGRTTDVGALRTPVVQRTGRSPAGLEVELRLVDLAEMFGLDAARYDRVDLFVAGPQVLEGHRLAVAVRAQHVLLDVEADGAGNGI